MSLTSRTALVVSCLTLVSAPLAHAAISVGSSSLIGTLHYSDTFTIGAGATVPARAGYVPQTFPLPAGVGAVENNYGNPAQSWGDGGASQWSIATDASNFPTGISPYPGTSGAGSDTGFTQKGGGGDWSIPYGIANVFTVQFDYVQQTDRVDVSIGSSGGNIFGAGNLSLFFRRTGHGIGEVGIYNAGVGETITGLSTGIAADHTWNNYAIRVDIPGQTIEVFTNEVSRGVLNLATLNGGLYAPFLNNAFVGLGGGRRRPPVERQLPGWRAHSGARSLRSRLGRRRHDAAPPEALVVQSPQLEGCRTIPDSTLECRVPVPARHHPSTSVDPTAGGATVECRRINSRSCAPGLAVSRHRVISQTRAFSPMLRHHALPEVPRRLPRRSHRHCMR